MNITLYPKKLKGEISVPSSKSYTHRVIMAASLAKGDSVISNVNLSEDINSTIDIMKKLGAKIKIDGNNLYITGNNGNVFLEDNEVLECNESGSTLRFAIPLVLTKENNVKFSMKGKLSERPIDTYYEIFEKQGISYSKNPLTISGKLKAGEYELKANISSQFITGLLYSLPLLEGDSTIILKTELESKSYVDMTIEVLKKFGINIVSEIENGIQKYIVFGNQNFKSLNCEVEGDYSQAAFFIVANELGSDIKLKNLNENSIQSDKEILNIIKYLKEDKSEIKKIDLSQCPDLGPIVSVLASLTRGTTQIVNAQRLRIKESDRITAITTELKKLGADICETEDGMIINGVQNLKAGVSVDSWNDHRIAMSLGIASTRCDNKIVINNAMCVKKSYPNFWEEFKKVSG